MFGSTITVVEEREWCALTTIGARYRKDAMGPCWVRFKEGLYGGDLGLVEKTYMGDFVDVLVVPRLVRQGSQRPTARLLSPEDANAYLQPNAIMLDSFTSTFFRVGRSAIKYGLHSVYCPLKGVETSLPLDLREVEPFAEASFEFGLEEPLKTVVMNTVDEIRNQDILSILKPQDRVLVLSGLFVGKEAVVRSVFDDTILTVDLRLQESDEKACLKISSHEVRRLFKTGDHVRVRRGFHMGKQGIVVTVDNAVVTIATLKTSLPVELESIWEHEVCAIIR